MGINSLSSNGQKANGIDITKDLIQRIKELSSKFDTIEKEFADIGPAMETIISIRDQLHNIEQRTISIVDQFQDQIFGMEDKADQIIIDLNKEVTRIETHIDDLLGLAENFGDIADEIKELLKLNDKVTDLQKTLDSMDGGGTSVSKPGENVPLGERKDGQLYVDVKEEADAPDGSGKKIYRSQYTDSKGNIIYFETDAKSVVMNNTSTTTLFRECNNLEDFIGKLDTVLSKKTYCETYYATLTANYTGEVAPYTQNASVPGLLETDEPIVGLIVDDQDTALALNQEKAFSNVTRIVANDNSISVYCNKKKPEVALKLRLVVFRTDK